MLQTHVEQKMKEKYMLLHFTNYTTKNSMQLFSPSYASLCLVIFISLGRIQKMSNQNFKIVSVFTCERSKKYSFRIIQFISDILCCWNPDFLILFSLSDGLLEEWIEFQVATEWIRTWIESQKKPICFFTFKNWTKENLSFKFHRNHTKSKLRKS